MQQMEDLREEWTRSEIMNLIEQYKAQDCLWNVKNQSYRDKRKRHAAWRHIASAVGHDVMSVERKMKVLKTQFMHCYKLLKKYSSNGEPYQPKWFAYKSLKFLIPGKIFRENREISRMNEEGMTVIKTEPVNITHEIHCEESDDTLKVSQELPTIQEPNSEISVNAFRTLMKQMNTPQRLPSATRHEPHRQNLPRRQEMDSQDAPTRDEFTVFGELIACRLRKIKNARTRLTVQFNITNLIFDAEMQEFDQESGVEIFDDNKGNMF